MVFLLNVSTSALGHLQGAHKYFDMCVCVCVCVCMCVCVTMVGIYGFSKKKLS